MTVNLSPASLSKEGPAFDLSMPLARHTRRLQRADAGGLERVGVVGELSRRQGAGHKGAISMAEGARGEGLPRLVLPEGDTPEASVIGGVEVFRMRTLQDAVDFLGEAVRMTPAEPPPKKGSKRRAGKTPPTWSGSVTPSAP